uniref:Vitrin n=1 Tax=Eptatretus burgeri TaxID=7764 RepID=A0A8C4WYY5_EPTBU
MCLCGGHSDLLLLLLLLTAVRNVECETTGYEIIGDDFLVLCPGQCLRQQPLIWGSGVYASISSVCGAAIHSGVLSNSKGGMVRVSKKAGMQGYVSKFANGLRSISLPKWSRSFVFPEAARSMAQSSQQWEQESLVSIDDKVDGRRLSFEAYRKGFLSSEAEAKPAAKDISSPKGPNPFQQYIGRNLVTTSRKPTTTTVPPKKMNKDCNVDIAFLIEGSWSLGVRRFESQKRFVTKVVEELQKTTDGAAVGLIQFG